MTGAALALDEPARAFLKVTRLGKDTFDLSAISRAMNMPQAPRHFLVVGAWGDVLAGMGTVRFLMAHWGVEEASVLYLGNQPGIPLFLQAQPWVREVRQLPCPEGEGYWNLVEGLCAYPDPRPGLDMALRGVVGVDPNTVAMCQVDYEQQLAPRFARWYGADIPEAHTEWALETLKGWPRPWWVLHPHSFQSCPLEGHWGGWPEALRWLQAEAPGTLVLTGMEDRARLLIPPCDNVLDLLRQTGSMLDVFALANAADGTITTACGLSMWAIVNSLPCVTALNGVIDRRGNVFRAWVDAPRNRLIGWRDPLSRFQLACRGLFLPHTGRPVVP